MFNLSRPVIIISIGVSSLFACSCSGPERHKHYESFPDNTALQAQVIHLDTTLFRYPYRVAVKDGIAIILDTHNADYYYHAFKYPEWTYLISFGKRGEAPDEMLLGATLKFNSLDSVWVLDPNKMQITRWSISPESHTVTREEVVRLHKDLIRTLDFYATDEKFIVPDYRGEARYCRVNPEGKILTSEGFIPTEREYEENSQPALAQAWRSFLDYHPGKSVLALVTQFGEVVEIYNEKENKHIVCYGPGGEPEFKKSSNGKGIPTGMKGFSDIQVTDHYIYTIFQGMSFKEIAAALKRGEEPEDGGRHIYVFALDGTPVREYTLDHSVSGFYVDEEAHKIIAVDVNSDDPVVEYTI